MCDTSILASVPRSEDLVAPADPSPRRYGLPAWRSIIATWRKRVRFRRALAEKAKANPHLIADMGLKSWQVEAEIAKPFWRP